MPYDLFISYSRRDNTHSRVTQLVKHIQADFEAFAGRPLEAFFDLDEIHGMQDWRHRILEGVQRIAPAAGLPLPFLPPERVL